MFAGTSAHYDALYSEKDYRREAEEIVALVERHRPGALGSRNPKTSLTVAVMR